MIENLKIKIYADDYENLIKEALEIWSFAENIFIKIPVVDTKGNFNGRVIKELSDKNVKLNSRVVLLMCYFRVW